MASVKYNLGRVEFAKGNIDWESDTIKMDKMPPTYTPDVATDQYYSDVSSQVVGTTQTLANGVVTNNSTANAADCNGDDTAETNQTITFDKVIVYKDTGTPATSVLISCHDVAEGTLTPTDGDLDLSLNVRGLFAI